MTTVLGLYDNFWYNGPTIEVRFIEKNFKYLHVIGTMPFSLVLYFVCQKD